MGQNQGIESSEIKNFCTIFHFKQSLNSYPTDVQIFEKKFFLRHPNDKGVHKFI